MVSAFFGLAAAAGLTAVAGAAVPGFSFSNSTGPGPAPSSCVTTAMNVLSDAESKLPSLGCIAPGALMNIITQTTQNASAEAVIGAIDTWLTGMCGVGFCNTNSVEIVEFQAGTCSGFADGEGGIPPNDNATIVGYYPAVREMMCLKNSGFNNSFCMTHFLAQANSTVSLNAPNPFILFNQLIAASFNMGCNDCTKAATQIAAKIAPVNDSSITASCGADFAATLYSPPVGITQTAVDTVFQVKKNGAAALVPTTAVFLFTIFRLFTLL